MKTVVPYTQLHPQVLEALDGHDPTLYDVSGSDEAYWELFERLWSDGETFCVVEHDIVVRPDSLEELAACPSPWCSFEIPYVGITYAGLGCVRFSGDLIARTPGALERVAMLPADEVHPPRHWCRLDARLQDVLRAAGEEMCVHAPPLRHLREDEPDSVIRPSHGCWR